MVDSPAVKVEDLTKRYRKVVALDQVSFDVPSASILGLLGPNGSGKTTTVGILSTALRPDSGRVSVCGLDVERNSGDVRGLIGLAGQFAAVDANLTGRENLKLIGRLSRVRRRDVSRRAEELLDRFSLADAADRLVRTYSGGMRRRLDVASALLHRPRVLFLDEPTTGLDPESRIELWRLVRELVDEGTTVLLTTQYLEEADELADRIVILNQGKVIESGTSEELKARVGSAVVELGFADADSASRASVALKDASFAPDLSGSLVAVTSDSGSAAIVEMLRALEGRTPDPIAVDIRESTLDDVFLALVGKPSSNIRNEKGVNE